MIGLRFSKDLLNDGEKPFSEVTSPAVFFQKFFSKENWKKNWIEQTFEHNN